ncbi:protein kinase domain-containing protein [Ditylenchus destructor]|uniref:non-specific serine/threonine protein kinase n=1 Tax=Ditylenchus destructor TaxID=166010 RepID=A0AAD4QW39_9BILA|nr:protein kinase domain-containing protein [Ditylenchus destructor]
MYCFSSQFNGKSAANFNATILALTRTFVTIMSKYALKLDRLALLYTEIDALDRFDHPHVIKCLAFYNQDQSKAPVMVLELAAGGDLFRLIDDSKLIPIRKVERLFYQILSAMSHIHHRRIVHRDLKPENILLDANHDNIKVTDFGLAEIQTSKGELMGDVVGTYDYMCPEMWKQDCYTSKADMFSVGCILYELELSTRAFDGTTTGNLIEG